MSARLTYNWSLSGGSWILSFILSGVANNRTFAIFLSDNVQDLAPKEQNCWFGCVCSVDYEWGDTSYLAFDSKLVQFVQGDTMIQFVKDLGNV